MQQKKTGSDRINVALIILAAGLSERMGVFKPLLPVGKQPAVVRCISTAKSAGIRDILVVTGHSHDEIEKVLRQNSPDARLVHNNGYRSGMFSSVCTGVAALPDSLDGFLLLPADCCAVKAATFTALMDHFAKNGNACITRPKYGKQGDGSLACVWKQGDGSVAPLKSRRGHPPLIPGRYIAPLLSYNGKDGLKGFLSSLPTLEVEMPSYDSLLDMDTPKDYAKLLTYLDLPTYPSTERCAQLLAKYEAPPHIIEHGKQVAELAAKMARPLQARGINLDLSLLESACLLHDICRMLPNHAQAGMDLLLREGYPKAAILVGSHMDMKQGDGSYASHGLRSIGTVPPLQTVPPLHAEHKNRPPASPADEAQLLYLADKLCRHGKIIPLDETMRDLETRFAKDPKALKAAKTRIKTAQAIQDTLAQYGINFKDTI